MFCQPVVRRVVRACTLKDVMKGCSKQAFMYRLPRKTWRRIHGRMTLVTERRGRRQSIELIRVPQYYLTLPVRETCSFERDVRVRNSPEEPDHIYGKTLCAPGFSDVPYAASRNEAVMLRAAARKRILCSMPNGEGNCYEALGSFVDRFLKKHFVPFPSFTQAQADESFEDWLAHYNKPMHRKEVLRKLYYERERLTEREYRCKSFIKREWYEEPKLARFINSRTDNFKVKVAAFTHLIEKEIFYGKISQWFVKGKRTDLQPSMISKMVNHAWFLATDYTSFESGFSPILVDNAERRVWRFFLQNNPEELAIFERVYEVDGKAREERLENPNFRIKVTGTRMSGEMWTSLANGLTNLLTFLFLANTKGMYPDAMPLPEECPLGILVEGDDGLFGLPEPTLTSADFARLGWKIKMDYTRELGKTSFCSNYFSPATLHQLVCPEAAVRVFYSFDSRYYDGKMSLQRKILKAKAMSLLCSGGFSPITASLARNILRLLPEEEEARFDEFCLYEKDQFDLDWQDVVVNGVPTPEDRVHYSEVFGVTISEQLALEELFDSVDRIENFDVPMCISKLNNFCTFEGLGPGSGLKAKAYSSD